MCLIAFSYRHHPKYELIVLANRDEFFARQTEPLHFWAKEGIYAGRDGIAGGTWMGLSKHGQFAALTNYRDMKREEKNKRSRGEIVVDLLHAENESTSFFNSFDDNAYNGFNVIFKNDSSMYHYSNISKKQTEITPGIYGVSNALLDSDWPKVNYLKSHLVILNEQDKIDHEQAFMILQDDTKYPDSMLPKTGVPHHIEHELSAAFIKMEEYGTRSSTVLTLTYDGDFEIFERSYVHGITDEHYKGTIHHPT